MAKATETTVTASKGKQLQATVSPEVYDAYDAHHWDARKNVVDLVRDALHEYGVKNGFLTVSEDGSVIPTPKA